MPKQRTIPTWIEDELRHQSHLFLGHFSSETQLERYAKGRFRKELGLPERDFFTIVALAWGIATKDGDLKAMVSRMVGSAAFYKRILKLVREYDMSPYNAAIVVIDHFTDDDIDAVASKVDYFGVFEYDPDNADCIIEEEEPQHLVNSAHVWIGHFQNKKRFARYIDEPRRAFDDDSPISQFASEQRENYYDHDRVYAEYFRRSTIEEIVESWGFADAGTNEVIAKAKKKRIKKANACFVADKRKFSRPRSVKGEEHQLWYIGSFDSCNL